MSKYSVVIPCYKSDKTIEKVVCLTSEEFERLGIDDYEFVLVNDCSPDGGLTREKIREIVGKYNYVTGVDLAKNAGQHNAIMAGLNHATGDYIIAMDDDMQTHPSQLGILLDEIKKGYDVVYGYYPEKKHSFIRNIVSKINAKSIKILLKRPKWLKTSSYYVMTRMVRDNVITYRNSYSNIQGLILRTTQNISCVPIEHFEREVGTSTYTFKSLFKLYTSIIGFSIVPLRICEILGIALMLVGVVGAIAVLIRKLFFVPGMALGWSSMMVTMFFFFGMMFLLMGLIGEYIGRIFLSLNNEPQYVVRELMIGKGEKYEEVNDSGSRDLSGALN